MLAISFSMPFAMLLSSAASPLSRVAWFSRPFTWAEFLSYLDMRKSLLQRLLIVPRGTALPKTSIPMSLSSKNPVRTTVIPIDPKLIQTSL